MRVLARGALIACMLGATLLPVTASAGSLKIGGTGAVTSALSLVGAEFTASTGITLVVIPSLGTGGALAAAADGVLDVAVAGRDLKEKELDQGLRVAATLRTPFGLVTSRPGPDDLASGEIAELYAADKPTWRDGTPLRIVLRPVEESDNVVLGSLFPGMTAAIATTRLRPDISVAATDQDNAAAAEATEGSLVGATLTQILTEKRDLRFIAIDGVAPSLAVFEDGTYPYGKTLFVVVPAEASVEAEAFVAFLASPQGEAVLRKAAIAVVGE